MKNFFLLRNTGVIPPRKTGRPPKPAVDRERPVNTDASLLASTLGDRGGGVALRWLPSVQPTIEFDVPPQFDAGFGVTPGLVVNSEDGIAEAELSRTGVGGGQSVSLGNIGPGLWDLDWYVWFSFRGTTDHPSGFEFTFNDPAGGGLTAAAMRFQDGMSREVRGRWRLNLIVRPPAVQWSWTLSHGATLASATSVHAHAVVHARRIAALRQT